MPAARGREKKKKKKPTASFFLLFSGVDKAARVRSGGALHQPYMRDVYFVYLKMSQIHSVFSVFENGKQEYT